MYTKENLMPREILGLLGIDAEILGAARTRVYEKKYFSGKGGKIEMIMNPSPNVKFEVINKMNNKTGNLLYA